MRPRRIQEIEQGKYSLREGFSSRQRNALYQAWDELRLMAMAATMTGQKTLARRLAARARTLSNAFSDRGIQHHAANAHRRMLRKFPETAGRA